MKIKDKLTDKQRLFVLEYLIDLNASAACVRAGYKTKWSETLGSQLLRKKQVKEAVDIAIAKRANKLEITAERVLAEIAKLSFVNLQDFYNENGSLKEIHELPRDVAAALSSSEVNLTEACAIQKIKLHDKRGALELLGKHLKLFTDRIEIDDKNGLAERLRKARERTK